MAFDSERFRLQPGERILWQGQPKQGLLARAGDFFVTPFAAFLLVFVASWEWEVIARQQWFEAVFGVPFVALGLWLLLGRLLYDVFGRSRTWYALTDRRAIVVRTTAVAHFKTEALATLKEVNVLPHNRGDFTLAFGPMPNYFGDEMAYERRQAQQVRFERIQEGDGVWELIHQAWPQIVRSGWLQGRAVSRRVQTLGRRSVGGGGNF